MRNIYGWGAYSSVLTVTTPSAPTTVPDKVSTPSLSIAAATGNLEISWTKPAENGATIDEYLIELRESDGSTYHSSASCNGADGDVVSDRACEIPMSELWTGPYNLAKGDDIHVRVSA